MRFSCVAALGLVLVAVPAMAQQPKSGHLFGSYTCAQPTVPCDRHSSFTGEQWSNAGITCLATGLGYVAPKGVFDDLAGLDTSNCLTTNASAIPQGKGASIVPHCCVTQLQNNTCGMHCTLSQE